MAVSDKEWITDEDLPLEFHFAQLDSGPTHRRSLFQEACDTFERNFILRALEKSDWNVTATARYLGIPLSTLKHKMDGSTCASSRESCAAPDAGHSLTVGQRCFF